MTAHPYARRRTALHPESRQIPIVLRRQPSSLLTFPPHPLASKARMKRSHSPSPTARAKVHHSSKTSDASGGRLRNLSFDQVFYDELILVIFSYLSARDLCTIQPTNKNWARLSQDNQVHSKRDVHEAHEGLTHEGDPLRLRCSSSGKLCIWQSMAAYGCV